MSWRDTETCSGTSLRDEIARDVFLELIGHAKIHGSTEELARMAYECVDALESASKPKLPALKSVRELYPLREEALDVLYPTPEDEDESNG